MSVPTNHIHYTYEMFETEMFTLEYKLFVHEFKRNLPNEKLEHGKQNNLKMINNLTYLFA